jgi:predicted MPP superfamily phosphohydrolase
MRTTRAISEPGAKHELRTRAYYRPPPFGILEHMPPWLVWLTLGGWISVVVAAATVRGRQFATFAGVLLGIHSLVALEIAPLVPVRAAPAFVFLHAAVYVNFVALARPRMKPFLYRLLVSWPGSFFAAGTLFALPWAIAHAAGFSPWGVWVPYALAAIGLIQSLRSHEEEIHLVVGDAHATPHPLPHERGRAREERPLRIVQISDPHIGPFMSVERLRRIAESAVKKKPDIVCLTGDFLTMESQSDPELLRRAFEPLAEMRGRVFACHGNHDLEAPETVRGALEANGITLLVDDATVVETEAGRVHVVGMDFRWRDRAQHLTAVCSAHPRIEGTTRVVMLHDPGAFKHLPEGQADLVLSGHTHGGQVGLLSLGLSWTFLRLFGIKIPDHGFWARGRDRMYVHRGTGHYGFPLRVGVPSEESVLHVHRARVETSG